MELRNHPYDTLRTGQTAEMRRLLTADDLYVFAASSGNHNLAHLPGFDPDGDGQEDTVAPGMFIASLVSAVLGTYLPGPGTLYRKHTLNFHTRAHAGDELLAKVQVTALLPDDLVRLTTTVTRLSDNALILDGEAEVIAPRRAIVTEDIDFPGLIVERHRHFRAMLDRARPLPPLPTAVVCPYSADALAGPLRAAEESLITPILIGDPARIAAVADGADLTAFEIIPASSDTEAAVMACTLVHQGKAAAIMKGHLHTDDLLRPMMDRDKGLRTGRRMSHIFVMDVPGMPYPVMVTDAAINIAPDLKTKVDIVQNAIDLALALDDAPPRVGILSAVETVNPDLPSSVDAALLSKMAERGQITGGLVDGPLAMDNAVSLSAAKTKGIKSPVAGQANILVVPDIDAGNMLAKQLTHISHAEAAGLVIGAQVPVILNSRSDDTMSRLASCAVAALYHHSRAGKK